MQRAFANHGPYGYYRLVVPVRFCRYFVMVITVMVVGIMPVTTATEAEAQEQPKEHGYYNTCVETGIIHCLNQLTVLR